MWSTIRACTALVTDREDVEAWKVYSFSESGNIFLPIAQPMRLVHQTGKELATILVMEFTNTPWRTVGTYKIHEGNTTAMATVLGIDIKFNRALQIDPPDDISVSDNYRFEKDGNRSFPLNETITLIDMHRTAIAEVLVTSYTNTANGTVGLYQVKKVYGDMERQILTEYRSKGK